MRFIEFRQRNRGYNTFGGETLAPSHSGGQGSLDQSYLRMRSLPRWKMPLRVTVSNNGTPSTLLASRRCSSERDAN